jgi:hypothetical protein
LAGQNWNGEVKELEAMLMSKRTGLNILYLSLAMHQDAVSTKVVDEPTTYNVFRG